jgi:CubicO group peptidase (beta-lactamase class C family)
MFRPLAILLAALAPAAFAAGSPTLAPDPVATVALERIAETEIPACLAISVVDQGTRFTYGCSADAGPAAFTQDSIFEIGSISKVFVGLILADMVRKGELSIDDAAAKHSRPGAKLPSRGDREITLNDLVTHTSALPRMPPHMNGSSADPFAIYSPDQLYESLAQTTLSRDIGVQYEYSNFGFMWLSEIVSRVGGKPFAELVRERVLLPLGMKDTSVALDAEQGKRLVPGHDRSYKPVRNWDFAPELAGVGGLRSSIADMARFAEAIAGTRTTPLDETIALATQPLRAGPGNLSLGYAWHIRRNERTTLHLHNGGTGGYRSMLAVDRGAKRAAVVLVDSVASFDDLPTHLLDASQPMVKKRVAIEVAAEKLDEYAFPLFAEGADRFFARVVNAQVAFNRGADGKVESLTLFQGGREMRAPRVAP